MENIVYCFTFPNEKKYIGKTQQGLDIRLRSHRYGAKHIQNYLYNAIRKFGWDEIRVDVLGKFDTIQKMNELEKNLIQEHNTTNPAFGYNLRSGGEGGAHSQKTKDKISKANKGKGNGMYGKTSWNKGKKLSKEHRGKLSESHKGQIPWNKGMTLPKKGPHSEEAKQKISKANSGANNGQAKLTWDEVVEIREKYASGKYYQKELAEKYGLSPAYISSIVNYKRWKNNG